MTKNLSEQFASARTDVLEVDGRTIRSIYRRPVQPGQSVRIHWVRAREIPVQGVCLGIKGGALVVNGQQLTNAVFWHDTAPAEVTVEVVGKRPAELQVWNCWRDERGTTQAWIGNAGLIVEEIGGGADVVRIRANSAPDLTFEDLVVELSF